MIFDNKLELRLLCRYYSTDQPWRTKRQDFRQIFGSF